MSTEKCPKCGVPCVKFSGHYRPAPLYAFAPILLQMAEATLELMENGLGDLSPAAKKFEGALREVIAQVKGEK